MMALIGDTVMLKDGTLTVIKNITVSRVGKTYGHTGGFCSEERIIDVVHRPPTRVQRYCRHCGLPIRQTDHAIALGVMWAHVVRSDGKENVEWGPEPEQTNRSPRSAYSAADGHYAEPEEDA